MVAGDTFAALVTELRREARAPAGEENWAGLTGRETEVLALMAEDVGTRLIAARLGVSEHTARGHVKQVLRKLRVHSRRDAVLEAARTGLLAPRDDRRGEAARPGPSGREDGDMDFPYGDRLRAEFGPARDARQLASSPRSNVWHASLDGTPAVVKQIIGGPDASERFTREVTALRLAARTVPTVVPRLLGADPGSRTLVLEHLSDEGPSPDWVVVYAAGLARLHATTGPTDAGALPRWEGPGIGDVHAFLGLAGALGISAGPDVADELNGLVERLDGLPGHALLHGDPCPANDLYVSGDIRFVDLEQSSLGNGLTELAYLRIGFPTCWCVTEVTTPVLERAEAAYHATWEAATGSPVAGDLVDACAGWLIRGDALVQRAERGTVDHLARVLEEDWSWGTVTARERLAYRLGVVADLARDHPDLGGLSRLSSAVRDRAVVRWPGLGPPPWHHGRAGRPGADGLRG